MSRDASLRPHGQRYSFSAHAQARSGDRMGNCILRQDSGVQHWKPCWGNGVTVFRPFPTRDWSSPAGQWEPFRYSAETHAYSDWIRKYETVRGIGDPGVTFITTNPVDETPAEVSPAHVLYNAISRAVESGQDQPGWAALLRGGNNRRAMLSRPTASYLIQGCIMQNKTEVMRPPKGLFDSTVMLELSAQAGFSLLQAMDLQRDGVQAASHGQDWESIYVNGDPVGLDHGRFITFYKAEDGDPRQARQGGGSPSAWTASNPMFQGGPGQQRQIGYGVFLEPTFNGTPASLIEYEEHVRQRVRSWDDILWFPTVDQQAKMLAERFDPTVIMYAFANHPDWIPENVRRQATGHVSVGAPQGGWGVPPTTQGYPPAGGGFGYPPAPQPGVLPPPGAQGYPPVPAPPAHASQPGAYSASPTPPVPPAPQPGAYAAPSAAPTPPASTMPPAGNAFGAPAAGNAFGAPAAGNAFGAPATAAPVAPTGGQPMVAPPTPPVAPPQGFATPATQGAELPPWATAPAPQSVSTAQPMPSSPAATAPPAGGMPSGGLPPGAEAVPVPGGAMGQPADAFAPVPGTPPAASAPQSRAAAALAAAQAEAANITPQA